MTTPWIIWCIIMGLALAFAAWCMWQERKEENAFFERMRDPEFAARYHAQHANDDWEDMGYFDGR